MLSIADGAIIRYKSYFDQAGCNCYMLEKDTFLSKVDHQPLGYEWLSLKYIVLAHGASASPTYCHLQNKLYETSRAYFEMAENCNTLFAIVSLQTCTLLATFELQQLLFIRGWDRINRAMWMAEMFDLHKMDAQDESPRQRQSGLYIAPTTNPQELEERRRTFWSVFILCCFKSISVGSNTNVQMNRMEEVWPLWLSFLFPTLLLTEETSRLPPCCQMKIKPTTKNHHYGQPSLKH